MEDVARAALVRPLEPIRWDDVAEAEAAPPADDGKGGPRVTAH
jgi:hypothetical protein